MSSCIYDERAFDSQPTLFFRRRGRQFIGEWTYQSSPHSCPHSRRYSYRCSCRYSYTRSWDRPVHPVSSARCSPSATAERDRVAASAGRRHFWGWCVDPHRCRRCFCFGRAFDRLIRCVNDRAHRDAGRIIVVDSSGSEAKRRCPAACCQTPSATRWSNVATRR